jgi:hypothetical protein
MGAMSEQAALVQVHERLSSRHSELTSEDILAVIQSAHASFDTSPIRDFVPLLVERRAGAELLARDAPTTV